MENNRAARLASTVVFCSLVCVLSTTVVFGWF